MKEQTDTRIQMAVEQIVRPVRAIYDTKYKMREEPYTHLCALYEEERPRAADEETAIQAALERLGDVPNLRRHLQSPVSYFEQVSWRLNGEFLPFLKRVGFRKKGETALHCAIRVASVQTLICVAVYMLIAGALLWLQNLSVQIQHPLLAGLWVGGANWVIFSLLHLLGPWFMGHIVDVGAHSLRWGALMALAGMFIYCCGLGMLASVAVVIMGPLQQRFLTSVIFLLASVWVGRFLGCQFYGPRSQQWLSLPASKQ